MNNTRPNRSFKSRNRLIAGVSVALLLLGLPDRQSPESSYARAFTELEKLLTARYPDYARFCVSMLQLEKVPDDAIASTVVVADLLLPIAALALAAYRTCSVRHSDRDVGILHQWDSHCL